MGMGVTAYGVLSRGLLFGSKPTGPTDFRAYLPRFSAENLAQNQALVTPLKALAAQRGATASQVAIAWVLAKAQHMGLDMVALVGSRTLKQLRDQRASFSFQS
jgi:aryl-alcohol dehydrogenase-like predicted oxidoreductase